MYVSTVHNTHHCMPEKDKRDMTAAAVCVVCVYAACFRVVCTCVLCVLCVCVVCVRSQHIPQTSWSCHSTAGCHQPEQSKQRYNIYASVIGGVNIKAHHTQNTVHTTQNTSQYTECKNASQTHTHTHSPQHAQHPAYYTPHTAPTAHTHTHLLDSAIVLIGFVWRHIVQRGGVPGVTVTCQMCQMSWCHGVSKTMSNTIHSTAPHRTQHRTAHSTHTRWRR